MHVTPFGPEQSVPPVVSVAMITYNHEPYIRQAIESAFAQITDFPFELVIGEDCSTDRTRNIINDVCTNAPISVYLITSESNIGVTSNFFRVINSCRGKFTALLDGDDFWIDPLKLKRQFEVLRHDNSISLCGHRIIQINDQGEALRLIPKYGENVPIEGREFMRAGGNIHTSSMMFRNYAFFKTSSVLYDDKNLWTDYTMKLLLADRGYIAFCPEIMSAYRAHVGGVSHRFHDELEKWLVSKIYALDKFGQETNSRHSDFVSQQIAVEQEYLAKCKEGRSAKMFRAIKRETKNFLRRGRNFLRRLT